jgi:hypothetical protein
MIGISDLRTGTSITKFKYEYMQLRQVRFSMLLGIMLITVSQIYGQSTTTLNHVNKELRQETSNWYVMVETGDDCYDGKSENSAFKTLSKAKSVVEPGDTVFIGNAIYTSSEIAVVEIRVSGREDVWITWKALPRHQPEIHPKGWNGVLISGSYHIGWIEDYRSE